MAQESKEKMDKKKRDKFVRYSEGAELYHMSLSKFMQLAKDVKVCYKYQDNIEKLNAA